MVAAAFTRALRRAMAPAFLACALPGTAQVAPDSLVTLLPEITVAAVKQQPDTELSAVTVITPAEVSRLGIVSMKDVSELAPNFYLPQYGSRMTSSVYVRGLGARIDQPVVGLCVDGVSYINKDNYDFDLFDIASIDVFRGAQSILNGRNTMAGQINITTLSPWQFSGLRLMAEMGNASSFKGAAAWYGRISPSLATSVTAYVTGTGGFFRNDYNGERVGRERQASARWKLAWRPAPSLSVTNVAAIQSSRQNGYPYRNMATGLIATDDTCFYWRNSFTDGLSLVWTRPAFTLSLQASVQTLNDNMTLDQDFLPLPYFTLTQRRREFVYTRDLYVKGRSGAINWLAGSFVFHRHTRMSAPVTFKEWGITHLIEEKPNQMNPYYPISWDDRTFPLFSDFTNCSRGMALYGQLSWLSGPWRLEGGLRWDLEKPVLDFQSHCRSSYTIWDNTVPGQLSIYNNVPVQIYEKGCLRHRFNQLLPKIAAGFSLHPGAELYANVAKGYKAGGFNTQMFSDFLQQKVMELMGVAMNYDIDRIVSYKPEQSWNFEVGARLRDRSVHTAPAWTLDATLFYILCTDQQLTTFPDGLTTGRIMTNAGRTRSLGAELQFSWRPAHAITLRGSYGFTDARFIRYNNGKTDLAGCRLPYAPSNTAFLSATWRLPLSLGSVVPSLDVNTRGVGDIYWNDENTVCQPFFILCGASLTLDHPRWNLRFWADNITSTRFDTFYFVSMGNAFAQRGRPFACGATLRLSL